jgi:hypothetical protein
VKAFVTFICIVSVFTENLKISDYTPLNNSEKVNWKANILLVETMSQNFSGKDEEYHKIKSAMMAILHTEI